MTEAELTEMCVEWDRVQQQFMAATRAMLALPSDDPQIPAVFTQWITAESDLHLYQKRLATAVDLRVHPGRGALYADREAPEEAQA